MKDKKNKKSNKKSNKKLKLELQEPQSNDFNLELNSAMLRAKNPTVHLDKIREDLSYIEAQSYIRAHLLTFTLLSPFAIIILDMHKYWPLLIILGIIITCFTATTIYLRYKIAFKMAQKYLKNQNNKYTDEPMKQITTAVQNFVYNDFSTGIGFYPQ